MLVVAGSAGFTAADDPNMELLPVGAGAEAAPGEAGGVAPNTNIPVDEGGAAAGCSVGFVADPKIDETGFSVVAVLAPPKIDETEVSAGPAAPNNEVPLGAVVVVVVVVSVVDEPNKDVPGVVDDPNMDPVDEPDGAVDDDGAGAPNMDVVEVVAGPPKIDETSVFAGGSVVVDPKIDPVGAEVPNAG